jgi:prolyl oligopeptidase
VQCIPHPEIKLLTILNMKYAFLIITTFLIASCSTKPEAWKNPNPAIDVKYPETKKIETTENFHGTDIRENYRWLEDDMAPETKEWVEAQNKVTFGYLDKIPFRAKFHETLEKNFNYEKYSQPFKEGDNYFFFKNNGLQNQSVMYIQKGLDGAPEVFLDPNTMSKEGTTALSGVTFSKDHKYCTYNIAKAGSDWNEIHIIDVATRNELTKETLEWVKFSSATWYKDGFYYCRYDNPGSHALSSQNNEHKVYYHKLGTTQADDALVYSEPEYPKRYQGLQITEDDRFMFLYTSDGASDGNRVMFKDLSMGDKDWRMLWPDMTHEFSVVDNIGEELLVNTNYKADNRRVIRVNVNNTAEGAWTGIVAEEKELLEGASTGGGKLFTTYLKDAYTKIYVSNLDGTGKKEIELPGIGTSGGLGGYKDDKVLFYSFTSFTYAPTIFKYDVATGKSEIFKQAKTSFNPDNYEVKQVKYKSLDGTEVPMFIIAKKGLKLDGTNPCYQYGYGGFNINVTPSFVVSRLLFVDQGGVVAIPNIRGGGEYGKQWHEAGTKERKQNVFNDFIAASEYLIKEKYTNSKRLAIEGRSNGGLLVGACMTQRPELYGCCIPGVGVLDMLRFQRFTIGWGWCNDYGNADSTNDFKYLVRYSPVHNVQDTAYPPTLIVTGDHDDRVVPAHSFKFAATLQEHQKGSNPTLIRIDVNAGHGAGKPTSKVIDEGTDVWCFIMYNLGMQPKYE